MGAVRMSDRAAAQNGFYNEVTNEDGYGDSVPRGWSAIDAKNSRISRDLQIERTRSDLRRERLQRVADAKRLELVGDELGAALEGLQAVMRVTP